MSRLRPDQLVVGRSYRVVVPATDEVREPVTVFGFELGRRRVQVSDGHDRIIVVPTSSLAFYERVMPVIPAPIIPVQIPPEVPVAVPQPVLRSVDGTDLVHSAYNGKSRDNECPVCMEALQPKSAEDMVVVIETTQARATGTKEDPVRCGEKFHRACLRNLRKCPVCNLPIVRVRPGFPEPMTAGRRLSRSRRRSNRTRNRRAKN
jgi:hypothetical protein